MHLRHRRPRTVHLLGHRLVHRLGRRPLGAVVLTAGLALAAAGCGHENDKASDDAEVQTEPPATSTTTTAPANDYPDFAPEDYTYELEVLCYCPQVGVIGVVVADGKVTEAKSLTGETKGQDVPEFGRLTINDIIARANDPKIDEAEVTWPAGQDYPSTVALDHLEMATDDEVTYTIKDVQVTQ
ncbi:MULTISPECIES: DUF6174 domain-containing protein [unclassified Nocardioides]|uniref:DUF6174 domain-containing protein n=1 Tax=unclassified Nocardioides TaxID=2615069 RepID=UPI0007001409|nr:MULTISPECIES: DUF6174 domain-containing protein [unclassified Nocardioides]KRA38064.1 hypothetical protein ASD81_05190 [Nocardioides sp. Root614]KRA92024.1 hypothetical protein ASD84_05455 [Nocardioides sp. Root682]